ncbi:MAG TPA: ComEC/Rec2 family competence protein [Chitinophagaceae bacterium]|nr:ComEC/Rec2 family competence protein [Chitinophagaceae bacterium]
MALGVSFVSVVSFFTLPYFSRFRFAIINGLLLSSLFLSSGAILAYKNDLRNNPDWLGNHYREKTGLLVTLQEPLIEKTKSFKANASVEYLVNKDKPVPVKGNIIIYFKKDSSLKNISYGSRIILNKPLQEIKNSGNPGGFDYKRYCLFQGITHQVYLKPEEFILLNGKSESWLEKFILNTREKVLNILRKNIKGEKELGLAEALLIGYKDDLDQNLVQSYTNTGVVHIIAISGLHLGLIYWLLVQLLKPLKRRRTFKWLNPVLIVTGLWLFSLLAGAQPSVLRSALMFTCIVLGESFGRKTSVFNTMALSAFILLCINPYSLWDVGFQLSYAAVSSIIIFMKPVYNWFYVKNKILDFIWKLNAVTIAAQVLTVPISIYHFHQFPTLFLFTNFLAVPLSSFILIGEIFLCTVSFIPVLSILFGKVLSALIWFMNTYIERIESIPFSLWDRLQITILQTILLLLFAAGSTRWLLEKSKKSLLFGSVALLLFVALRSYSFIIANHQQKIIVYNVPQKRAIDFVDGRKYLFIGDQDLLANDFARNFHLKPSRVLYRTTMLDSLKDFYHNRGLIFYKEKKILLIDTSTMLLPRNANFSIDLLVISKNPKLYLKSLASQIKIKQVVFDGSVPAWKVLYWKKDCDSLNIPWHDVTVKGAFVMNL